MVLTRLLLKYPSYLSPGQAGDEVCGFYTTIGAQVFLVCNVRDMERAHQLLKPLYLAMPLLGSSPPVIQGQVGEEPT